MIICYESNDGFSSSDIFLARSVPVIQGVNLYLKMGAGGYRNEDGE